jgi:hypothetical protein
VCHHSQLLLIEMGISHFFARAGLYPPSSSSLPPE